MIRELAGKYKSIRKIGEGGMATVFLARQSGLHNFEKIVAIKTILPHLLENSEAVSMFTDEARIAAQLNHPNIIQVYDFGLEGRTFYISLEYVHGCSLHNLLTALHKTNGMLPLGLTLYIMTSVCRGLEYAHNKTGLDGKPLNIIHRDLDPQNILLGYDGQIKISDFGLAKTDIQTHKSMTGDIKGKANYMSPELLEGKKLDQRADIFALGVIFYQLVTGQKPFRKSTMAETMRAIIEGKYEPLSKACPDLPESVSQIVDKSLAIDRNQRFASVTELLSRLDRARIALAPHHEANQLAQFLAETLGEETTRPIIGPDDEDIEDLATVLPHDPTKPDSEASVDMDGPTVPPNSLDSTDSPRGGSNVSININFGRRTAWVSLALLFIVLAALLVAVFGKGLWQQTDITATTPAVIPIAESPAPPTETPPEETPAAPEPTPETTNTPVTPDSGIPAHGFVIAKVDPPGAHLFLNGSPVGKGPVVGPLKLPSGKKAYIKAELAGYTSDTKSVLVEPGKTGSVNLKLSPKGNGFVSINADVGSKVFIDGSFVGETPIGKHELSAGSHTVVFKSGLTETSITKNVKVKPNETSKVKAKFLAALNVQCEPWANVYLDSVKIGQTPLVKHNIEPGIYLVRLENPELGKQKSYTKEFHAGQTVTIHLNFAD